MIRSPSPQMIWVGTFAVQPALQPWIEEAWLPAETRAGDAVENGEVLVFVGAGALGGFRALFRVGVGEARVSSGRS